MNTKNLIGRRARFQRKSDYRFFHGWVLDTHGSCVILKSRPDVHFRGGDEFAFEVSVPEGVARFDAVVLADTDTQILQGASGMDDYRMRQRILAAADLEFEFEVTTPIRASKGYETSRFLAQATAGKVTVGEEEFEFTVCDVSEKGLGALSSGTIPSSVEGVAKLETPHGDIEFDVSVRYCRRDPNNEGLYRIGMEIIEVDRVSHAKWKKLSA